MTLAALLAAAGAVKIATVLGVALGAGGGVGLYSYLKGKFSKTPPVVPPKA